jgi:pheromone shutdown protein TraB
MKIKKVLILVELENGHAHQVLASSEQKYLVAQLLRDNSGVMLLSHRLAPVQLAMFEADEGLPL